MSYEEIELKGIQASMMLWELLEPHEIAAAFMAILSGAQKIPAVNCAFKPAREHGLPSPRSS